MTDGCTNFRKFLVEGTKPNFEEDQRICRAFADACHRPSPRLLATTKLRKLRTTRWTTTSRLKAAAFEARLRNGSRGSIAFVDPKKKNGQAVCGRGLPASRSDPTKVIRCGIR